MAGSAPAFTSEMPWTIIQTPTPMATSRASRPERTASASGGGAVVRAKAATAIATTTRSVTAMATPPMMNRPWSSAVALLKCEGTPRACCSETQATSSAVEAHSSTEAIQPVLRRIGR
ncbi:MAG TPA: hypothetical protein VGC06_13430 [Actinomycetes bacterium]